MAAGASTKTVYEIFMSMECAPPAWLDQRSRSLGFFIDGKFVCPAERRSCHLTDSKGVAVCSTACAEQADVSQCCSSAVGGFAAWSSLSCDRRAKVLLRLASVLGQHGQCVSELCRLCDVSGSPSVLIRLLQYYSSWARLRDTLISGWAPLGVVQVVASEECSLFSLMIKVLPALAMGNSVVVVPGQSLTPPSLLLAQLFSASGLPAGTLNVLPNCEKTLGAGVAQNPSIKYVAYTGNKQDGVKLCEDTAGMGVPVSVSPCVGASCPFIIFESADLDSAVDEVIEAAFRKKKEVNWLLYVQESAVDSVVARLKMRLAGKECVALRSEEERGLVDAAVLEAQQQGATLIQSGPAPPSGPRYPPTVLCGAAAAFSCVVSPAPGPLLPLMTFRGNTEAVTLGNHSPHGQAASIWTEDLTLALETANSLAVGSVWVNAHSVFDPCLPASGHKDSGSCTDGGQEGLYQFLRPSSCSSPLPRSSPSSVDYKQFGASSAASPIIPDESGSAPQYHLQFVGGKPCKSVSGRSVPVLTPGGDAVLAYVPDGGRKDVRNAVEAAIKVQPGWMKKRASARAQSLYALAKALEAKGRDLAASLRSHTGLSVEEAEKEVELSGSRLTLWAAYCDKVGGGSLPMPRSGSALSFPEALGVVGVVLPKHKPLLSMVTLLGAAVATGNAVVMVPNRENPLPVLAFIQVLQASDLPAGLVNIITGSADQLTAAIANHGVIKGVWYWGSAEGCQFLQYSCTSPIKTLRLFCQNDEPSHDWTSSQPSLMEEMWRNAVQWKSVWIPTA